MRNNVFIKKRLPILVLFLAFSLFALSMVGNSGENETAGVAEKTAARLQRRLGRLESFAMKAMSGDDDKCLDGLPDDMVVYKYENDSLKFWSNQFPLINDDISRRLTVQRLTSYSNSISSPLSDVTEEVSYMNLGPKWYVVKAFEDGRGVRVIAGIEIKNNLIEEMSTSENGTNPHLRIGGHYSVSPITSSTGSPVMIDGLPLFKVQFNLNQMSDFFDNSLLRWTSLILLAIATMLFLFGHRSYKAYFTATASLTALFTVAFAWGVQMSNSYDLFSPTLYADGQILFSLGALILINTFITAIHICTYMMRDKIAGFIKNDTAHRRRNIIVLTAGFVLIAVGMLIYTHVTLRSLILNSNISMELYRGNSQAHYTTLVYLSYTGLLFCLMLMIQSARPVVEEMTGMHYNVFKIKNLAIFAFFCSLYFTATAAVLGFRKEQDRVTVWANRLAVERDLGLEIQLRSVEEAIASDQLIATLTRLDNTQAMILNRIADYHLARTRQGYNTSVMIFRDRKEYLGVHPLNKRDRFNITGIDAPDTTRYLIQALNRDGGSGRVRIKIDPQIYPITPVIKRNLYTRGTPSASLAEEYLMNAKRNYYAEGGMRVIDIEEVVVTAKRINNYEYSSALNDFNTISGDMTRFSSVFDALQRFRNLEIVGNSVSVRTKHIAEPEVNVDEENLVIMPTEENENERVPKVYVNGQEMDINAIDAYPMAEIISISYLDKEESLSANTGGEYGAIILQVRDINARQQFLINSMAEVIVPGYCPPAEFYAPDYSIASNKEKRDNRTTIAWHPLVKSDALGGSSISFYAADRESSYRVLVEGVTNEGELIYKEIVIPAK